jgi:hypothetical protein
MRLFILLFLLILTPAIHSQMVIVCNKKSNIKTLSKESIRYLYLAKVNKINNVKIQPLLSKDKELHERFVNTILDKDILQYSSYWARLVFTGRKPIPRRLNYEEIDEKLNELNTIIYIDKKNVKKDWKIIYER